MIQIVPGSVVWVDLSPVKGREQTGRRPAVVVSSQDHLDLVRALAIVVPCTTTAKQWPNHVQLTGPTGLTDTTFAMTEQPRAISRTRIANVVGGVDQQSFAQITMWLRDWIAPETRANCQG